MQTSLNDGAWTYTRNAPAEEEGSGGTGRRAIDPGKEFLFDRGVDPGENVNLIAREPGQALVMREAIDHYLAGEMREEVRDTSVRIDPSIADRLRAMGYLE